MRYPGSIRSVVVTWLLDRTRVRWGERGQVARRLGVSRRTLELWVVAHTNGDVRRVGRPPATAAQRRAVLRAVGRLARKPSFRLTWRSVRTAVSREHPTRLVQHATAAWKQRRTRRRAQQRLQQRIHVELAGRDVIWSMDGTHLGRLADHSAVEAQVVRDVATRRTLSLAVGRAATGEEVVRILKDASARHSALPRVLATDNGPIYRSRTLARYLANARVVHLRSLPHTPQHNAWVERAIGELKQESGLGKGMRLSSASAAALQLALAWRAIDHGHQRPALQHRTAADCYQRMAARYPEPDREKLFWSARSAIQRATLSHATSRERRRAEREAIYATLEDFGLVQRTRGGVPFHAVKCEAET